ncbi:MAG: hypothetical protein ACTSQ7_08710 [Alphaproteobacteria bacterium]
MTERHTCPSPAVLIVVLGLMVLAGGAPAQDAHYWDNQYGTKAELLGGLVVGSPTDLSATFYNPGWIALQNKRSVLLTTKAAEIYSIELENNPDRGSEPNSTVVASSPGYLAGRFSLGEDWGWQWAYTYLEKVKFDYNASGRRSDQDSAPPAAGNLWFSGEIWRDSEVDESWYGVSFARKLAENVAIGFSPYVAHRSYLSRNQLAAQALSADATHADAFLADEYEFWHVRVLLKGGLAWQAERWSAGLAVTTPSLGLLGEGSVYQNVAYSGDYDAASPGVDPPYLQVDQQDDLSARWKSPLSVAGGAAFEFGQTRFHATVEWFNSTGRYAVLDPEAYAIASQPDQTAQGFLEHAAQSVLNYGVGLDHAFNETFSLFTSYRADFSTAPADLGNRLSIAVWDLNHLTGGAAFQFLSMEFTAGLQYSWGQDESNGFTSFNLDEYGDVNGRVATRAVSYRRLKALLGFNLPFALVE